MSLPVRSDPSAFEALYRRSARLVWNALGRAGITRDAEKCELVQEVFLIAHLKLDTCDPAGREAWVIAIAKFVARDYRKLKRVQQEQPMVDPDALPEPTAHGPSPEDVVRGRRDYLALMDAVDADDRIVFEMHEVEGFEVPEIARALTIPVGTARTRLRRARHDIGAAVSRMRARDAHATTRLGLPMVLPFGAGAWSEAGRVFDDAPADLARDLWDGVCRAIARHGAMGAVVGVAGGAAGGAAMGATVAAKSSAAVFTGGLLVGGGAVAIAAIAVHLVTAPPAPAQPIAATHARDADRAAVTASPEVSSATAVIAGASAEARLVAPAKSATAAPAASASAATSPVAGIDPEEMRLYQQAVAASRSGDLDAATAALDDHARRFPRGAFAKDRDRMRASITEARRAATPTPTAAPDAGASRRMFGTDD